MIRLRDRDAPNPLNRINGQLSRGNSVYLFPFYPFSSMGSWPRRLSLDVSRSSLLNGLFWCRDGSTSSLAGNNVNNDKSRGTHGGIRELGSFSGSSGWMDDDDHHLFPFTIIIMLKGAFDLWKSTVEFTAKSYILILIGGRFECCLVFFPSFSSERLTSAFDRMAF